MTRLCVTVKPPTTTYEKCAPAKASAQCGPVMLPDQIGARDDDHPQT
jgi:hypothetical protein